MALTLNSALATTNLIKESNESVRDNALSNLNQLISFFNSQNNIEDYQHNPHVFNIIKYLAQSKTILESTDSIEEFEIIYNQFVLPTIEANIYLKQWRDVPNIDEFSRVKISDTSDFSRDKKTVIGNKNAAKSYVTLGGNINSLCGDEKTVLSVHELDVSGMKLFNDDGLAFLETEEGKRLLSTMDIDPETISREVGDTVLNIISQVLIKVEGVINQQYSQYVAENDHSFSVGNKPQFCLKFANFGGDDIQAITFGLEEFWDAIGGVDKVMSLIKQELDTVSWIDSKGGSNKVVLRIDNSINLDSFDTSDTSEMLYNEDRFLLEEFNKEQSILPKDNRFRARYFTCFGVMLDQREILSYLKGQRIFRTISETNSGNLDSLTEEDKKNLSFYSFLSLKLSDYTEEFMALQKIDDCSDYNSLSEFIQLKYGNKNILRYFKKLFSANESNDRFQQKKSIFKSFLESFIGSLTGEPVESYASIEREFVNSNILARGAIENTNKVENTIAINQGEQKLEAGIKTVKAHLLTKFNIEVTKENLGNWRECIKQAIIQSANNIDKSIAKSMVNKFFDEDVRLVITQAGLDFGFAFIVENPDYNKSIGDLIERKFQRNITNYEVEIGGISGGIKQQITVIDQSKDDLEGYKDIGFRALIGDEKNKLKLENISQILTQILSDKLAGSGLNEVIELFGSKISKKEFGSKSSYTTDETLVAHFQEWNNRSEVNLLNLFMCLNKKVGVLIREKKSLDEIEAFASGVYNIINDRFWNDLSLKTKLDRELDVFRQSVAQFKAINK